MAALFYFLLALLVFAGLAWMFLRADPRRLAGSMHYLAPGLLGLLGLGLILAGRVAIGIPLLGAAGALFSRSGRGSRVSTPPPRRSYVRSAALEMELDLDTGEMEGLVLAGCLEGRQLGELDEADLVALHAELASDDESRDLLEAYLDRRLPGWRERRDAHARDGLGGTPGPGSMTEQEAHEILGLAPGASEAEIREAHRRLMKRVHPDTGGSVFLAARINEAKDLLLRRHR